MYLERSVYFFIELDGRLYGVRTLTRFCLGVLKSAFMGTTCPCWLPELLSLRFSLLFTAWGQPRILMIYRIHETFAERFIQVMMWVIFFITDIFNVYSNLNKGIPCKMYKKGACKKRYPELRLCKNQVWLSNARGKRVHYNRRGLT